MTYKLQKLKECLLTQIILYIQRKLYLNNVVCPYITLGLKNNQITPPHFELQYFFFFWKNIEP